MNTSPVGIDPKLKAFLDLIAWSEGTSTSPITQNDGYDVIVSGVDGLHRMIDYDDHPFAPQYKRQPVIVRRVPLLESTAAGRYQLLYRYWTVYRAELHLSNFAPVNQDAVALKQAQERGALTLVMNDAVDQAIAACSNIWASFPNNSYGQGGKSMAELLSKYAELLAAK